MRLSSIAPEKRYCLIESDSLVDFSSSAGLGPVEGDESEFGDLETTRLARFAAGRPRKLRSMMHSRSRLRQRSQHVLSDCGTPKGPISVGLGRAHLIFLVLQPRQIKRAYLPLGPRSVFCISHSWVRNVETSRRLGCDERWGISFRVLGTNGPHGHGIGCRLALRIYWTWKKLLSATVAFYRGKGSQYCADLCLGTRIFPKFLFELYNLVTSVQQDFNIVDTG